MDQPAADKTLKTFFDQARVELLAQQLAPVHSPLDVAGFTRDAAQGLDALELMARAAHIARALHAHLPRDFYQAADILERSLGPALPEGDNMGQGMAPFHYLPHVLWVAEHGPKPERFDRAMQLQAALTRRFSAEFSIRAFWSADRERTIAWMQRWAVDEDAHVRRLVSEGLRPRLPWASRLPDLIQDPSPALALLEPLRQDPCLMVRRSVANHLNDVTKDHPALVLQLLTRWLDEAPSAERRWIARHALRTLVKRGDPRALAILGHQGRPELSVTLHAPPSVRLGQALRLTLTVRNDTQETQEALVDLVLERVLADQTTSPRVFKLGHLSLAPGQRKQIKKTLSFAPMSTRAHYPGVHPLRLQLNGHAMELGAFEVLP